MNAKLPPPEPLPASFAAHPTASVLPLRHGRELVVEKSGDHDEITVRSSSGAVEVSIELTATGPRLTIHAADLQLRSDGAISLDCQRFDVDAREGIDFRSQGDFFTDVAGNEVHHAKGYVEHHAEEVVVSARGNMSVNSEEDLFIDGRRVFINS